ncbi:MAG TPA: EAL domain-containing protein, partial [Bordetella sp.]
NSTEQTWRTLEDLRRQKIRLAIDDFGTGYSALSYLAKLPLDLLKIDRSFVLTIDAAQDTTVTLDAIIQLGHSLDVQLVAEGVDSPTQFDYLAARGVMFIQGYLFARPMPSAQFAEWYAANGARMAPQQAAAGA